MTSAENLADLAVVVAIATKVSPAAAADLTLITSTKLPYNCSLWSGVIDRLRLARVLSPRYPERERVHN